VTALVGGKGLQKFKQMVHAQGGDVGVIDDPSRLPQPRSTVRLLSRDEGYISHIDALEVGKTALMLGAGRTRSEDRVDHAAGIQFLVKKGDRVKRRDPLALLFAKDRRTAAGCGMHLREAVVFSRSRPKPAAVVVGRVTPAGIERLGRGRRG
jgi:pyrimidine-nucleoside phosphorylase